jgi:hypothetical protein
MHTCIFFKNQQQEEEEKMTLKYCMKVLNLGQVAPTCKIIIPYIHVPN